MNGVDAGRTSGDRAVLFDYGGVLTVPLAPAFGSFEAEHGIPPGRSFQLMMSVSQGSGGGGPIGALERGELSAADFEAQLRGLLVEDGFRPPATDLIAGMFERLDPEPDVWDLAAWLREQGVRTGLLSNSWGIDMYPWDRLDTHFDLTVVSGQVGLRKPDPAIFELALEQVGLPASSCAFIDDLERNVEVAASLGLTAIHHTGDAAATRRAVESFVTS